MEFMRSLCDSRSHIRNKIKMFHRNIDNRIYVTQQTEPRVPIKIIQRIRATISRSSCNFRISFAISRNPFPIVVSEKISYEI